MNIKAISLGGMALLLATCTSSPTYEEWSKKWRAMEWDSIQEDSDRADARDYEEVYRETRLHYDKYRDITTVKSPWGYLASTAPPAYRLVAAAGGIHAETVYLFIHARLRDALPTVEPWSGGKKYPAEITRSEFSCSGRVCSILAVVRIPITRVQLAGMAKSGFDLDLTGGRSDKHSIPTVFFLAFKDKLEEIESQ